MTRFNKLLDQLLRGTSDKSFEFDDLRHILLRLGFAERTKGGHHIFDKAGVTELVNLQRSGKEAKAYQVRQVRDLIHRYRLFEEE